MKKGSILSLILILLILHVVETSAQDSTCCKPLVKIGARIHKDVIVQHSDRLKDELVQTKPWSMEMDISWHLRKKEVWEFCYCYPRTGFVFQYTHFDFPEVLGSAFSLIPFIEPYIRADRKLSFSFRVGIGPSLVTRYYNELTNPDNLFFGSHLNFNTHLNLALNYRITDNISTRLGANYHHISNAGIAQPNLGMNYLTVNAGLDYSFQKASFENMYDDPTIEVNSKKNRFDLMTGIGVQPTPYIRGSQLYPVVSVFANYSRVIGKLLALNAGFEFTNDRHVRAEIREDNILDEETGAFVDHKRISTNVGVEWLFGRFIFSPQFGYYLYTPYPAELNWYQRYSISYKINTCLLTGVSVKAYIQDAYFVDVRFGVFF